MLNTYFSYIIYRFYSLLFCELTTYLALRRRLDIFIGSKMVHDDHYFIRIHDFSIFDLGKFTDGYRSSQVISKDQIYICFDQFSGFHRF